MENTEKGNSLIEFSKEEKKVIISQFFPQSATREEMQYCMNVAKNLGLNPILGQIYFVPRKAKVDGRWVEKLQPLAGRDAFLSLAHRSKKFAGIKSWTEIREVPKLENDDWVMKKDLVGIAEVYRKDSDIPFIVEVQYSEYLQTTRDGTPNNFWKTKPDTMIKKVAESQALRKAFNISGLFDENEIDTRLEFHEREIDSDDIDVSKLDIGRPVKDYDDVVDATIEDTEKEEVQY